MPNENDDLTKSVSDASVLIENTISNINNGLINMYFDIGKMITNYNSINNSKHGDSTINQISDLLQRKYGSGFNRRNIYRAIKFYQLF